MLELIAMSYVVAVSMYLGQLMAKYRVKRVLDEWTGAMLHISGDDEPHTITGFTYP